MKEQNKGLADWLENAFKGYKEADSEVSLRLALRVREARQIIAALRREMTKDQLERRMVRAHRLAERIMVVSAKAQAEAADRRTRDWGHFYDPLAVTCLGSLIYETMSKP